MEESQAQKVWNIIVQICLPLFTLGGFFLTAMKLPQYGVIASLVAQIFWLYASYRAWKQANQIGIFVNTCVATLIFAYGVINYWLL
jgi:hypothetical protein